MPKPPRDRDNPEWTAEDFANAKPAAEAWGPEVVAAFKAQQRRRGRGPQKAPTKQLVSLRLNRDTIETYRATGRGWQARIDDDLAKAAKRRARSQAHD